MARQGTGPFATRARRGSELSARCRGQTSVCYQGLKKHPAQDSSRACLKRLRKQMGKAATSGNGVCCLVTRSSGVVACGRPI
jgi:hypothetical protein